jgi:hypothetical protein
MRTTRAEYVRLLTEVMPNAGSLYESRTLFLPELSRMVMQALFIKGDVTSPAALAVRYQMAKLSDPGSFDFIAAPSQPEVLHTW